MVLGKREKKLMDVVYGAASRSDNGQCLMSPMDILTKIPYDVTFHETDLEETMNQLALDNYFEYEKARKSATDVMYIITLKENGISYLRDKRVSRRKFVIRILITLLVAIISFSFKSILDAIFS